MPYLLALVVWQTATLLLYLGSIWMILSDARHKSAGDEGVSSPGGGGMWLLLALAYPAVFINLGHGHNGFLTAALLGCALVLLDRRPLAAGILLGLVAYKPQFGLMIPLALAAGGTGARSPPPLRPSSRSRSPPRSPSACRCGRRSSPRPISPASIVLEAGDTGWHKIQSVFAWVRMWGGRSRSPMRCRAR